MTLNEAINYAFMEATGKVRDLTEGDLKYNKLRKIANLMCNQWENELGVEWQSRREIIKIGDVDLNETIYRLPKDALKLARKNSAKIIIENNGEKWFFGVEEPRFTGWQLDFDGLFTEEMVGGEIKIPVIKRLPELISGDQQVEIDNPNWLIFMMAAEFARNDLMKSGQYGNLIAYAQSLMEAMKMNNEEVYAHEVGFIECGGVFND